MQPRAVAGAAVDECSACQGLWIPEGHLEQLVERARKTREATSGPRPGVPAPRMRSGNPAIQRVEYRRCPECDTQMQRRNFWRSSGIIVDVCRRHGTWLDPDELERIAGFVLAHERNTDFVTPRDPTPAPEPGRGPADTAFARILAEHRVLERKAPGASQTLFDILFGLIR
jgi:Zn-finger nucleic acid-binding protein